MKKIQIIKIVLLVTIIFLSIILIFMDKYNIINQLKNWKLFPQPETYTELYFDNNSKLPFYVKHKQQIKFSFTVHNLEYKPYAYPYNVYLDNNNKIYEINKGSFTLNQDQHKTISDSYTLTKSISRAQIVINLTKNNQDIFFWITSNPLIPTPTPNPKSFKINMNKNQQIKKHFGAWYWQPLLQKALIWLGLDKLGHDIWGSSLPIKTTPTPIPSSNSNSNSTPTATPTPKQNTIATPTIIPTQLVTPTIKQTLTPTPTIVQSK